MTDKIELKSVAMEAEIIRFPRSYDPQTDERQDSACPIAHDPLLELKNSIPPDAQLVTVKDVQRILSIGRSKAFQLLAEGRLERRRIDGCTRITMSSVMAFVEGK